MSFRLLVLASLSLAFVPLRAVEPLSKSYPIDFFRDIPSRNLKGLATRSDGRLVAGPTLTDLDGPTLPSLLWCLEPIGPNHWLVGSGPDGKVVEVTLDSNAAHYTVKEIVTLPEQQVLTIKPLADGSFLAGTSPDGGLFLVRGNTIVSQALLPADSVFDIVVHENTAFVATGNPAKIYAVDLPTFASAGVEKTRMREKTQLASKGIKELGEVRDRNIRRLAWVGGKLIAGSAPKGNIYAFAPAGGPPLLLQENREAEVSALLPQPDGSFYAAVIFATTQGETRINHPTTGKGSETVLAESPAISSIERFAGRSTVVFFPKDGFPETTLSRAGVAFYAIGRRGDNLIIAGGEQGDFLGYDLVARESLSFAGSDSSQLNAMVPLGSGKTGEREPSRFLALRNNAPGLALLDFDAEGPRSAETRRLDLGVPARVGAVRIGRVKEIAADKIKVDLRTSFGNDEIEGWTNWAPTERSSDGWIAPTARAREVKLRIQLPATKAPVELDDATLFYLSQNRRPQIGDFHVAPANFALLPASESSVTTITLSQLLSEHDERRKPNLTSNNVVPSPGTQLITWNVTDADGDAVACTFSVQREGSDRWEDISVGNRDGFAQFDTSHFEDGVYLTRLTAIEQAPRPIEERLSTTFQTEDLIIDHTPPVISDLSVKRKGDLLVISVTGHDALSLLDGAEYIFNNGVHDAVSQPADGIRDSQTETFVLEIPLSKAAGATSVQVLLSDAAGNSSAVSAAVPQGWSAVKLQYILMQPM